MYITEKCKSLRNILFLFCSNLHSSSTVYFSLLGLSNEEERRMAWGIHRHLMRLGGNFVCCQQCSDWYLRTEKRKKAWSVPKYYFQHFDLFLGYFFCRFFLLSFWFSHTVLLRIHSIDSQRAFHNRKCCESVPGIRIHFTPTLSRTHTKENT